MKFNFNVKMKQAEISLNIACNLLPMFRLIPKRCQNNLKDKSILFVFNLYKLNIVSGLV
jgi:hypothetical protein